MTQPTDTLYGLCQLIQFSGNPLTTATYKLVGTAGENTSLNKYFELGATAELRRTSKGKAKNRFCLSVADPSSGKLINIPFETGPIFEHAQGTISGSSERAIIVKQDKRLNLFVHKDPSCIWNCLSNPDYWHNHWPYTCSEKQYNYAPIDFKDRAYEKFLRGDEGILADMDYLLKNIKRMKLKQLIERPVMPVE